LELEKIGEELKGDLIKLTDEIIKLVSFKKKKKHLKYFLILIQIKNKIN
jgi:hypothetical protein